MYGMRGGRIGRERCGHVCRCADLLFASQRTWIRWSLLEIPVRFLWLCDRIYSGEMRKNNNGLLNYRGCLPPGGPFLIQRLPLIFRRKPDDRFHSLKPSRSWHPTIDAFNMFPNRLRRRQISIAMVSLTDSNKAQQIG